MADLRSVALTAGNTGISLARTSDDQVLQDLAVLLLSGVLHVHRVPARATAWRTAQKDSAPAEPEVFAPRRASSSRGADPQPAPKQVVEDVTFSAETDGAATAAVLRSAAKDGVPFCEECAKAAARRAA